MIFFAVMALSGLLSVVFSESPRIGFFYWLWTIATIFLVPLVLLVIYRKLGDFIFWTISLYFLIHGLVIFWDLGVSNFGRSEWVLGRVNSDPTLIGPLYRAYAWNFEPSYQAATGLLAALWIRFYMIKENRHKVAAWLIYLFILVSILATTSRTAFFAVPILLVLDLFFLAGFLLKLLLKRGDPTTRQSLKLMFLVLGIFLVASSAILIPLSFSKNLRSYANFLVTRSIKKPWKEGSFVVRFADMRMAWQVFRDHPIVGAGPGQAKLLFFGHPERYTPPGYISRSEAYEKNPGPLGNCVYTELLSDWGLVGFLAYLCGIFFMFWKTPAYVQWRLWPVLSFLYFTTGTVPRLDLWLYVGLIWALFAAGSDLFRKPLGKGERPLPDPVHAD